MRRMRGAPLEFLTGLARTYGDITRHCADGDTVYVLNHPDHARYVLKDNGANYTKEDTPDDHMLRPLLGNGLLTSDGEEWARQRRLCAPAFRPSAVRTFDGIITDAAHALADRLRAAAEADADAPIAVDHQLAGLTLSVLTRSILGADTQGIGEGFGRAVDAVNRFIGHYVPADDPDPQDTEQRRRGFVRARLFLDGVTRMLITARRAGGSAPDANLLDTMLRAQAGGGSPMPGAGHGVPGHSAPDSLTDTDLRDQVLTLVMAGHETTAKALTWTLYLLDRHPEEAERLREEVDRALAGRTPTAADLSALPRCRRAVQEAMRLYPPVWLISRRAAAADIIGGYDVEPGTLVCVSQWVLHRHPAYWDAPEEFRPDRFTSADLPSHLYLPFGGGDRICIGQHFAMAEATLVLAVLMQTVRLRLVPGHPVEPEALVTLRPRHGMHMLAAAR
jgi:cytochrome P450